MLETGMFVGKNTSAYLTYTADLETGIFQIECVDAVGLSFLKSINVGDKITLLKRNTDLCLLVTKLTKTRPRIQCKASAV